MRDKPKKTPRSAKAPSGTGKPIKIEYVFPEGQRLLFSNHMTVQHTNEGEFTLSFFEVSQPLVVGTQEEIERQVEQINSTPAHCLARVVVSAARMPRVIAALITNYEQYEKDVGKAETKADEQENQKHAS